MVELLGYIPADNTISLELLELLITELLMNYSGCNFGEMAITVAIKLLKKVSIVVYPFPFKVYLHSYL